MDRRELLKMITVLTGGAMIGAEAFLTGCTNTEKAVAFAPADVDFLNEVAETILPATNTPGAKAANVGQFMTVYVNDCYEPKDKQIFIEGIKKLDDACQKKFSVGFMKADAKQRHDLLVDLDKEAKDHQNKKNELSDAIKKQAQMGKGNSDDKKEAEMANHYFTLMKQMTLFGYFTSKEGVTKALNYQPVPGEYKGCVDYKKGDKALAGLNG